MTTPDKATAIERLAANALKTRFEDFDKDTLEATKYRIIDTLGCLIGGALDTGNPELLKLLIEQGGKKGILLRRGGGFCIMGVRGGRRLYNEMRRADAAGFKVLVKTGGKLMSALLRGFYSGLLVLVVGLGLTARRPGRC